MRARMLAAAAGAALAAGVAAWGAATAPAPLPGPPPSVPPAPEMVRVHFLALGGGQATLAVGPRAAVLVDGGGPWAGQPLVDYLRSRGVARLDDVVVTRPADDRSGGLVAVLESLPVGQLVDGGWADGSPLYRAVLRLAERRGIPVLRARRGRRLDLGGGVRIDVLLPGEEDDRPGPLVLRLAAGSVGLLLPGGLDAVTEEQLVRLGGEVRAAALAVGPGTAPGAVTPAFLQAVGPRLAVVAPGVDAEVVGRIAGAGATVLRLDRWGRVELGTDGRTVSVHLPPSPPAPGGRGAAGAGAVRAARG